MSWEAIRALPKRIPDSIQIFEHDMPVKEIPREILENSLPLIQALAFAAREAQTLLPKYDRAVELLRQVSDSDIGGITWNLMDKIKEFLDELEGKQ